MRLTIPPSGRPVDVALVASCVVRCCLAGHAVRLEPLALLPRPGRRR